MNVNELLDTIEDLLEESTGMPLSGGKRIVDVEQIRDYLDDIRANLPVELRRAAQQRASEIVSAAQTEARTVRQTVTDYCDNMLKTTEETMSENAAQVKNVRANLRQNPRRGV